PGAEPLMTTENPAVEAAPETPAARTPSRRYMARRDAIIASAIREMNRHGVRGMTLGDVAARLDLVPTGVIYYFRNKEDLAAAAFERSIGRIQELAEFSRGHPTERERVQVFIDMFILLQQRIELGEAEPLAVFNDVRALNCESVNQAFVALFRTVRSLLDRRDNRTRADLNGRAHLLINALTFVSAWIYTWRVEDYPRIGQRIASILLDGIPRGGNVPGVRFLNLQPAGDEIDEGSAEHFLRAATQLINDEGYHGASVDRISSKLNVTKGAFYHYNATKDDLVVACFQRTFDVLWRAIDAAEAGGDDGLEIMHSLLQAVVQLQVGPAPLLRTSALTTVPEEIRVDLMFRLRQISIRLGSMLCDGIADGSIRPLDASITAQILTAGINAASELTWWQPGENPETGARLFVDAMVRGVIHP
ncbi:MAG: TetR/AcrR family transcriptional regulator, partial [Phenylobacterium sp.]|nr:TetR/AcrR family transcriptional regulator [Phenylobacterium sp.]